MGQFLLYQKSLQTWVHDGWWWLLMVVDGLFQPKLLFLICNINNLLIYNTSISSVQGWYSLPHFFWAELGHCRAACNCSWALRALSKSKHHRDGRDGSGRETPRPLTAADCRWWGCESRVGSPWVKREGRQCISWISCISCISCIQWSICEFAHDDGIYP